MKLAILNASPKGNKNSISMRYVDFFKNAIPEHDYLTISLGNQIKKLEKDPKKLDEIIAQLRECEGIIWVPVSAMSVSARPRLPCVPPSWSPTAANR